MISLPLVSVDARRYGIAARIDVIDKITIDGKCGKLVRRRG